MTKREILIAEAIHYKGDWWKIVDAVTKKDLIDEELAMKYLRSLKCKVLTMFDPEYPEYLKGFTMAPIVLFYYGDISLLSDPKKCLAVVGTRKPSDVGIKMTREIVSSTSKKYITVSGLASGVDRIAHETALDNGGKTIAVLGCGIEMCYPSENYDIYKRIKYSKNNLILSEYPGDTEPDARHFPVRNRLIAQFSKGILVTESKIKSGTSITVNFGLEYSKEVMSVPSSDYGNSGCNLYIQQGAALVENAAQVEFIME